jgi:hypothetical protein
MNHFTNLEGKSLQNFDEKDFETIKKYFNDKTTLTNIDSRDCAILYGLWWKFSYTEGKPSKEMVFNSLYSTMQGFSAEELYQKAKEGGKKLGWKWIQKENTLYFRTLLLQGGIPLKNLIKYGTAYRKFLSKVIEQRPVIVSDIADNYEVIKDLPISTRNEIVFEAALNISKAIWDDTEEGREILNLLEQNQQGDLVNTLKRLKIEIEKVPKSQIKIKTFWELNQKSSEKANIVLKSVLPDKINCEPFAEMIGIESLELSASYNFFCDEILLVTYRKNIKGDFLKYSSTLTPIDWNPENQHLPELYFADASGKKYSISSQLKMLPDPKIPSLWVQIEEKRWIMLSKSNHNDENAFVLTSEPNHCNDKSLKLIIQDKIFYLFEIKESTTLLINGNESIYFKLNTTTFDWFIHSTRPYWIHKANMIVVTSLPRIYFYNEAGDIINDHQISKKWRRKGQYVWNEYKGSIPVGILELQFCHEGVTEYEKIFNMGDATLKFFGSDILKPTISFNHSDLVLEIGHNSLYNISNTGSKSISLSFVNANQIPKCIKAYIKSNHGNLLLDMIIPFRGIELVDKADKVVPNNHVFLLKNIDGYRIVSGEDQTIKFYNERFPKLIIRQKVQSGLIPLRNFNAIIQKLFLLADAMASANIVIMEIQGKRIQFKAYNATLSYLNEDGYLRQMEDERLLINLKKNVDADIHNTTESNYLLYAVPLNCELTNIKSIELERYNDGFCLPKDVSEQEFIVFDTHKDLNCKILPTYVTTNQANIVSPLTQEVLYQNKLTRIKEFHRQLASDSIDGSEWQKLNRYIELCNQFNLPFSAFDIIRAACSSSDLCSKLFFFLICYSTTNKNDDFIRTCGKMEEELGFRFNWCAFKSFEKAFDSTIDICGIDTISSILEKSSLIVEPKFLMFNNNDWKMPERFHLKTSMNDMRSRLGESVIDELPHWRPFITENRKTIIPIDNKNLKIMARCPIAIALVKLNLYVSELPNLGSTVDLWHLNNQEIRRNIIYCENLDVKWYNLAITYAINQIL